MAGEQGKVVALTRPSTLRKTGEQVFDSQFWKSKKYFKKQPQNKQTKTQNKPQENIPKQNPKQPGCTVLFLGTT